MQYTTNGLSFSYFSVYINEKRSCERHLLFSHAAVQSLFSPRAAACDWIFLTHGGKLPLWPQLRALRQQLCCVLGSHRWNKGDHFARIPPHQHQFTWGSAGGWSGVGGGREGNQFVWRSSLYSTLVLLICCSSHSVKALKSPLFTVSVLQARRLVLRRMWLIPRVCSRTQEVKAEEFKPLFGPAWGCV